MNILDDFIIKKPEGLYCPYGDFYLDPEKPVKKAIISHAHADHAKPGNISVYCTKGTKAIMQLRYKKNAAKEFICSEYNIQFFIAKVNLTFIPAGHILGSAMVLMEFGKCKYLYTGDYKLQKDTTCEPLEFCHADVLITETTFANPQIKHPEVKPEIEKINAVKTNILMGVYGLGKAQRITKLITEYCAEKKVLVHHSILPIHQLYEKEGINIGAYSVYNRKLMKNEEKNYVYLVPPLTFESYLRATGVTRIFASGWERLQNGNDLALYISDHVDWDDILATIKEVEPTEIWTLHGDGSKLKKYLDGKIKVKMLA